jgi:hypothetical protein
MHLLVDLICQRRTSARPEQFSFTSPQLQKRLTISHRQPIGASNNGRKWQEQNRLVFVKFQQINALDDFTLNQTNQIHSIDAKASKP